jgi:hypothetical protein
MNQTEWLHDSLKSLGHYDPPLVNHTLSEHGDEASVDLAFLNMVLWLEDSHIRQWYVASDGRIAFRSFVSPHSYVLIGIWTLGKN